MFETTMRKGLTYNVLNTGNGVYRIAAVIDTNKVVYSSNLHFVGDMYDSKEDAKTALDRMLCDNMQAGDARPMRSITVHSRHAYVTKASATRAAKKAIGCYFPVEAPELENRFNGVIMLTESMIAVSLNEGMWRWLYTFDLAEVETRVLKDGQWIDVAFGEVSDWADSKTPPVAEVVPAETLPVAEPLSLPELTERIEFYKDSVKSIAASKGNEAVTVYINRELPPLKAACATFGVTMSDVGELLVMVQNAAKSTDPSSIARVMVKAEPYGLHHRLERQLAEQASKRRLSVAYCMQSAREYLQRCAV